MNKQKNIMALILGCIIFVAGVVYILYPTASSQTGWGVIVRNKTQKPIENILFTDAGGTNYACNHPASGKCLSYPDSEKLRRVECQQDTCSDEGNFHSKSFYFRSKGIVTFSFLQSHEMKKGILIQKNEPGGEGNVVILTVNPDNSVSVETIGEYIVHNKLPPSEINQYFVNKKSK